LQRSLTRRGTTKRNDEEGRRRATTRTARDDIETEAGGAEVVRALDVGTPSSKDARMYIDTVVVDCCRMNLNVSDSRPCDSRWLSRDNVQLTAFIVYRPLPRSVVELWWTSGGCSSRRILACTSGCCRFVSVGHKSRLVISRRIKFEKSV
jgi:hypothetical protein